jgi:hypothetical protein
MLIVSGCAYGPPASTQIQTCCNFLPSAHVQALLVISGSGSTPDDDHIGSHLPDPCVSVDICNMVSLSSSKTCAVAGKIGMVPELGLRLVLL